MAMNKKENEIGYHNKTVKGREAVLTREVSFHNGMRLIEKNRIYFQPGYKVKALYEVVGTGLTVFEFKDQKGRPVTFQLREEAYKFIS